MKRTARRRGFTLLEAMLSLAILGLVLGMLVSVQQAARTALRRVRKEPGQSAMLDRGVRLFMRDCLQFVNPGFLAGSTVIDTRKEAGSGSGDARVSFYTAEYLPAGSQGIRKITYEFKLDKEASTGPLVRSSDPADPSEGSQTSIVVARDIQNVQLAFHDGKTFRSSWSGRKDLPRGIRISFIDADKRQLVWEGLFTGGLQ